MRVDVGAKPAVRDRQTRPLVRAIAHGRSQLVRESREYRRAREIADKKIRRLALRKVDARFEFV